MDAKQRAVKQINIIQKGEQHSLPVSVSDLAAGRGTTRKKAEIDEIDRNTRDDT